MNFLMRPMQLHSRYTQLLVALRPIAIGQAQCDVVVIDTSNFVSPLFYKVKKLLYVLKRTIISSTTFYTTYNHF